MGLLLITRRTDIAKNPRFLPRNQDRTTRKRTGLRKRILNVGTWNVQGINTKEDEVFENLSKYKMDIVALTETKRKGNGNEQKGNYLHFYSGVEKCKRAKAGVSIAIHKKWKNNIKNWEEINERIMQMEIEIWNHVFVIVAAYAPTDDATLIVKDEFQTHLTNLLTSISQRKEIVLIGDLNARVGSKINDSIVGRFGENITNDNGFRLIDICETHNLKILNGFFQHRDIHKFTWTQTTRQLKTIIDYVIIKQQTQMKPRDVRVCRGANCGSDHFLLKSEIFIKYRYQQNNNNDNDNKGEEVQEQRYKLDLLGDDSVRFLYKLRLATKICDFTDNTVENMYNNLKAALHDAAFEALGKVDGQNSKNDSWWNSEIESLVKEKQKCYETWLSTQDSEDRKQYTRINREVKKMVKRAKNETWERKCMEIDNHIGGTKTKMAWQTIKSLRKENHSRLNLGMIKMTEWENYYEEMLTETREEFMTQESITNIEGNVQEITTEEIKLSLKEMKNGKSSGPGGISVELLKNAPVEVLNILKTIFNKCLLNQEEPPKEWKMAYLTSIHKKGSKTNCKNYRGISVTATIGRLYGRVIKKRLENIIEIGEEQSGFTAGRSCVDNIFTIKQTVEKRKVRNQETHLIFIDLEKAYDTVPLNKLFEILDKSNVHGKYVAAIKSLYKDLETRIKVGRRLSKVLKPTKGLRQGCCLSPTLFKIYINEILKDWQNRCAGMGLDINGSFLHTLLFADDQIVIANDSYDIEFMMRKLYDIYKDAGLSINFSKTKYLSIDSPQLDLEIEGNTIQSCQEYVYLGVKLTKEGSSKKEVNHRINRGRQAISKLNSLLWSKKIRKKTKTRIYKTIVQSILLYGSETWEMTKRDRQRLEATEMDFLRRSCGVSRLQRITNREIRERMKAETTITEEVERRRLKWYGHVRRMDDTRWPKKILEWQPHWKRKRGRPPEEWFKQTKRDMERRRLEEGDWQDREAWRRGCERRPTEL